MMDFKYKIKDRVYCINKIEQRIDCGIITRIIIDKDGIGYKLELMGYDSYKTLTVDENLIGRTPDELYQQLKDNIKEYFPLYWR